MNTRANQEGAHPDGVGSTGVVSDCCGTVEMRGELLGAMPAAALPTRKSESTRQNRRGILALGAAAAAGAAVALVPGGASAHGTEHVECASAANPAIHGRNTAAGGNAILGDLTAGGISIKAVNDKGGGGVQAIQQALE